MHYKTLFLAILSILSWANLAQAQQDSSANTLQQIHTSLNQSRTALLLNPVAFRASQAANYSGAFSAGVQLQTSKWQFEFSAFSAYPVAGFNSLQNPANYEKANAFYQHPDADFTVNQTINYFSFFETKIAFELKKQTNKKLRYFKLSEGQKKGTEIPNLATEAPSHNRTFLLFGLHNESSGFYLPFSDSNPFFTAHNNTKLLPYSAIQFADHQYIQPPTQPDNWDRSVLYENAKNKKSWSTNYVYASVFVGARFEHSINTQIQQNAARLSKQYKVGFEVVAHYAPFYRVDSIDFFAYDATNGNLMSTSTVERLSLIGSTQNQLQFTPIGLELKVYFNELVPTPLYKNNRAQFYRTNWFNKQFYVSGGTRPGIKTATWFVECGLGIQLNNYLKRN